MTTAPMMISASGMGNKGASPSSPPLPRPEEKEDDGADVTVELNSELPLPYPWEQHLDMQTGELYYVNRENGTRTAEDPRLEEEDDNSTSEEEDDITSSDGEDSGAHSGLSSVSSPGDETATSAA